MSSSLDPRTFRVQGSKLTGSKTFKFIFTAIQLASGLSGQSAVSVTVKAGQVFALISGGSQRSVRRGAVLQVDGGASYDEDGLPLVYSWSCSRLTPSPMDDCGLQVTDSSERPSVLVLTSTALTKLSKSSITLTVSTSDGRVSTASVVVDLLPAGAPVSEITSYPIGKTNPAQPLLLRGSVTSAIGGEAYWAVSDSSIDLETHSLTPLSVSFGPGEATSGYSVSLLVDGSTLYGRGSFVFSLIVTDDDSQSSYSLVTVVTNGPPSIGVIAVEPSEGFMLDTYFDFSASQWQDDDLPITYEYAYSAAQSTSGSADDSVYSVVRSRAETPFCQSRLPSGAEPQHYVFIRMRAFDGLGSSSSGVINVTVTPTNAVSASNLNDIFADVFTGQSTNNDDVRGAIVLAGSVLNSVTCRPAVPCADLNRNPCDVIDDTCGSCHNGFFGDGAYGNNPCMSLVTRRVAAGVVNCTANEECPLSWQSCIDGQCLAGLKSCPGSCSQRGQCLYWTTVGQSVVVDECRIGDSTCAAFCNCTSGYAGVSCSLEDSEMSQRQDIRSKLIRSITNIVQTEDPDEASVQSWMNSIGAATRRPDELSDGAKDGVADAVGLLFSAASAGGVPMSSVNGVLDAVTSIATPANPSGSSGVSGVTVSAAALLTAYSGLLSAGMVTGQDPIMQSSDLFGLSVANVKLSGGADSLSLSTPLSSLEAAAGRQANSVALSAEMGWSSGSSLDISLLSARNTLYGSSGYTNDPLKLMYNPSLCGADCAVDVVLQNAATLDLRPRLSIGGAVAHSQSNFSVLCDADHIGTHNYTCASGDVLVVSCNDSWTGRVVQQCPVYAPIPVCTLAGTGQRCEVLHFDEATTTCRCYLSRRGPDRRLAASNMSATAVVEFATMLEFAASGVLSTWESADSLSIAKVQQSWKVLVTVGVITAAAVMSALLGGWADSKAEQKCAIEKSVVVGKESTDAKMKFSSKDIIEGSLPNVLREMPITEKLARELKVYHRWFGVAFFYSPHFSRSMRILSLMTSAILMLFANAVTYNLAYPDDGSCEQYTSLAACLKEPSSMSSGSKCYWDNTKQTCSFREPADDLQQVVFVAIIAAIVSTPLALFADYIIMTYLAGEVKKAKKEEAIAPQPIPSGEVGDNTVRRRRTLLRAQPSMKFDIAEGSSGRRASGGYDRNNVLGTSLQGDMAALTAAIRSFRETLSGAELRHFDGEF